MGRAERDRARKIRAHTHREQFQTVPACNFGREGEMRPRDLLERRDAHQPGDGQPIAFPAGLDERVGVFGQNPRLLRFSPGIDLDEKLRLRVFLLGLSRVNCP